MPPGVLEIGLAALFGSWALLFYSCSWGVGGCIDPNCVVDYVGVGAEVGCWLAFPLWVSVGSAGLLVLSLSGAAVRASLSDKGPCGRL